MSLFLVLIIVAVVLGLIGAVASGLGFPPATGIVFVADLAHGGWRPRRRPRPVG